MSGLAPGTVLARRWRVLARLGEGGMGSVYQVEDLRQPGVVYALKELLDDGGLSPEDAAWAARHFDDEIALLETLRHPRIPAFKDRFAQGRRRYFVMEYIPGTTLEERLERAKAPLPERDVLRWMAEVCEVLTYLHGQQPPVIVRDLKPGNIMVTPGGDVRLIDFGIARRYKAGKLSNTENLGTAIYASPEHHGHAQTDARSDIYSLGATMYHLLTNREPTPMETPPPRSLRRAVPTLGEATEATIIRAMQLDPARRFATAGELRAALEQRLAALPAPARTAVPSRPPAPGAAARAASAPPRAPARAAPPAPTTSAPPAEVRCPRCGHLNRRAAKFCARDGAPLHPLGVGGKPAAVSPLGAAPITRVVTSTSTAALHAAHATASFAAGRYVQAVRQGEQALAQGHASAETYLMLGRAYLALGRLTDAARAFEQAAHLRPSAEALLQEGTVRRELGQLAQAQVALTRARTLAPQDAEIPLQLGLLCLEQGQLAQAEGELREALVLRPSHVPTLVALGRVHAARGHWQEAIAQFQQAIAVNPSDVQAYLALGRVYLATQAPAEAVRVLESAARLAPQSAEAQLVLGTAYAASGRRRQAREALRRVAASDPSYAEAQRLLGQLQA